jgi:hypothetical protein
MKTRTVTIIAGIMAIGSSLTLGQIDIDTTSEKHLAKSADQNTYRDSGNTGIQHGHCREDSLPHKLNPTREFSFIGIGVYDVNLDDLNSRLNSSGISGFDPTAFNLSFGRHIEIKRLMLEGECSGLAWGENIDNGMRTSLYAANIKGHLGVNLLPNDGRISLTPHAGMGGGINGLRICSDKKTLNQAIENSDPDVTIWQGSFLLQVGLAADYVLASHDGQKGFVVGIRAGYQFAPVLTPWYSDDIPISDMPDMRQQGVFAKLVLGGWKPLRHKRCCCEKQ